MLCQVDKPASSCSLTLCSLHQLLEVVPPDILAQVLAQLLRYMSALVHSNPGLWIQGERGIIIFTSVNLVKY